MVTTRLVVGMTTLMNRAGKRDDCRWSFHRLHRVTVAAEGDGDKRFINHRLVAKER